MTLFLLIFALMLYKSPFWIKLKYPNAFLGWLGLLSCSQRSGMMFIIVFQSLVNLCSFTRISSVWFVNGHMGGKVLFFSFLQRGDSKFSLPLGALKVISPISTMLNFSSPLVFLNIQEKYCPWNIFNYTGTGWCQLHLSRQGDTRHDCADVPRQLSQSLKHQPEWHLEVCHQSFIGFSSLHSAQAFPFHPKWQTNAWELSSARGPATLTERSWIPRVHFLLPALSACPPALLKASELGHFWDVTGPALGSFAGNFLALAVYKLHRETAPHSRFRLPPTAAPTPECPNASRASCQLQAADVDTKHKQSWTGMFLCDNFWKDNTVPAK